MKRISILILLLSLFIPGISQIVINEYSCSNLDKFKDNYNEYEDFIELYNGGTSVVSLTGYKVSDDPSVPGKWIIPSGVTINAHGFMKIWCSGRDEYSGGHLHSNFRLTQTKIPAETLVLSDPSGNILDQRTLEITQNTHSRGRTQDGGASWGIFTSATPGTTNNTYPAYSSYTLQPVMDKEAGFYNSPITVTITTNESNVVIRYTLDGTEPITSSPLYSTPIQLTATTIVKARAFSSNPAIIPGLITFNTYFINEDHTVPVLSIAANNLKSLLNGNGNLMPRGSFEYFDVTQQRTDVGYGEFGKHGQDSWVHNQRSLDYKSRDELGYNSAIGEKLFKLSDREEFQRVILRASGDDNYPGIDTSAHIRDDFVQTLSQVIGMNLDVRKSSRCVIYTNGEFWGVYAIREKVDDHDYTEYYYGQSKFDLYFVMLWGSTWAEYGGNAAIQDWETLYNYIVTHSMAVQSNFDYVEARYDPTSLADYMLINSFVVCSDWLNWNVGWWKGLDPTGDHLRWGYILWDEDATFGHYINYTGIPAQSPYLPPCFHESLNSQWQDPEGHVTVLNKLLENEGFREYYINRYVDLLNTGLKPESALSLFDSLVGVIQPEMPGHFTRWGGNLLQWNANVQKIRNFYNARYQTVWDGMNSCYNTTGPYPVSVDIDPSEGAGMIKLNSLTLKDFPFSGSYFGNINIRLEAIESHPGYQFDHWEVSNNTVFPSDTSKSITINLVAGSTIVAVFEPRLLSDSLVINEINYHSAADFNPGDWIEFYNPHDHELDISQWKFMDGNDQHAYYFPQGTLIPQRGYLVLVEDPSLFTPLFPGVSNYVGPIGFGFSGNGELLRIYDEQGAMVDTVHYDDTAPWPLTPDGMGPTLELINPGLDNALAQSWAASCEMHGTPGEQNCVFVSIPKPGTNDGLVTLRAVPNPMNTSSQIIINSDKPLDGGLLVVYNILGKEVLRVSNISQDRVQINRGALPSGSYYVLFSDPGNNLRGNCKLIME